MFRRLTLLLFCLPLALLASAKPITYIWDLSELDSLRRLPSSAAYRACLQKADRAINKGVVAVTDKTNTISGDKHNYESLSIYWWPDPKNPNGPYIARDGEFNPEYKLYDYPRLLQLVENIRSCAQAYYLSGDLKYYTFVCQQLDAWFINTETRMNPDFNYCQFIPGRNGGRGNPQGMIDAYSFNDVLEGIRLTHYTKSIGRKRMKSLKNWFGAFANWMQTSDYGQTASNYKNNQAVAYDITLYDFFLFNGKKSGRKQILNSFYEKRVLPQIDEDGKMPEELKRTKAYTYSIYNLSHLIDFCQIIANDQKNLPQNISDKVRSSLLYLSHFDKKESFPYKEIGNWDEEKQKLKRHTDRFQKLLAPR